MQQPLEARRKAMDRHLVFLVKQTERYSTSLASGMNGQVQGILSTFDR